MTFPRHPSLVLALALLTCPPRALAVEPDAKPADAATPAAPVKPAPARAADAPDSADAGAEPAPASVLGDAEVITLPKIQVTRSRIREIDVTIRRLDKLISREKNKLKSNETDRTLNGPELARAAALFGGKSTEQRESIVALRIQSMESERELLEQLKVPLTRPEREFIEKQVEMLRTTRREYDIIYR